MTALANKVSLGQNTNTVNETGKSRNLRQTSSRKVEEVLGMGPQTTEYINKRDILVSDDDMLLIFGKVADKRYGNIKRGTTELRSTDSMKKQIEDALNEDLKICTADSIHHIEISVESFKHLFIEGVITQEMLTGSQVAPQIIMINNVLFNTTKGEIRLPIFVSPEFNFAFATVNNEGNTI